MKRTFNGKYFRLHPNAPAPTVHTKFGDPRYFLHPLEDRGFSVREAARLQGFPDSFHLPIEVTRAFRQIGNAVPPPLAQAVATSILEVV